MGNKKIKAWRPQGLTVGESTDKLGFFGTTPVVRGTAWTVTNHTADKTIDADGAVAVIGDGLGSLIAELIDLGIIQGTVS